MRWKKSEDYQLKYYKSSKNIGKALEEIEKDLIHLKESRQYEKNIE